MKGNLTQVVLIALQPLSSGSGESISSNFTLQGIPVLQKAAITRSHNSKPRLLLQLLKVGVTFSKLLFWPLTAKKILLKW